MMFWAIPWSPMMKNFKNLYCVCQRRNSLWVSTIRIIVIYHSIVPCHYCILSYITIYCLQISQRWWVQYGIDITVELGFDHWNHTLSKSYDFSGFIRDSQINTFFVDKRQQRCHWLLSMVWGQEVKININIDVCQNISLKEGLFSLKFQETKESAKSVRVVCSYVGISDYNSNIVIPIEWR